MERLKELMAQLKEQFDRKVDPSQMLETVRLVEAELQLLANQPAPARVMPTKITVMMPSASKIYTGGAAPAPTPPDARKDLANQRNSSSLPSNGSSAPSSSTASAGNNGVAVPTPPASMPSAAPERATAPERTAAPAPERAAPAASMPERATAATPAPAAATLEKPVERGVWPFDPLAEKPTDRFTLSQKSKEVNDVIGNIGTSLNDKLKSDISELKSALNDTPVRDLRKAIGVNDRYVFINHLFRGDEVMYERSIKTINGFRILPEAEYWMERELKVKLGWDENNLTTRHFYQLVKRRFS